MFHKVKNVFPLADFKLTIQFCEGVTKIYDLNLLFNQINAFNYLKENPLEDENVSVDIGGYGIIWNDDLNISCDELWSNVV